MRRAALVIVIILILIVATVFAWRRFNPGPLDFVGGSTVALSDYKDANPTGVPASLAGADVVKRGEYGLCERVMTIPSNSIFRLTAVVV